MVSSIIAVAVVVAEDGVDGSGVALGQSRQRKRRAEVAAEHQRLCAAVPDGGQRLGELIQVIVRIGQDGNLHRGYAPFSIIVTVCRPSR